MEEMKKKIQRTQTDENIQENSSHKKQSSDNEKDALLIEQQKSNYCEFCNQKCHQQKFKFFESVMNYISVSPNVTFYFKFLEFIIFILLFDFLFYGIITHLVILKNYTTFRCFLNKCLKEPTFEDAYQSVLHQILFTINLAFMILFKYLWLIYIRNLNRKLDENEITPSDYTVYLRGIDVNKTSQEISQELVEYFKKWDAEVVRINLIYDIDPFLKAIKGYTKAKQNLNIIDQKIKDYDLNELKKKSVIKKNAKKLTKAQKKLDESEKHLREFIGSDLKSKTKFLGKAYVTFQTQAQQRKIVKAHRFMIFQFRVNIGKYKIVRAYEPHDIMWENLGQKTKKRFILRFVIVIIGILIFCCSFCIALSFRILQKGVKINDPYAQYLFAFLVVLSLGTFLKIFQTVLEKLNIRERHRTITHYKISLGIKSVYSFFVNICCVLLSVNLIVHGTADKFLYGTKGVVSSTQLILNFIVFGDFLLQLMDLLLVQRQYHQKRHLERVKKGRYLKECERNQIRQIMQFNYTAHYNSIFKILVIVFFYQSILVYPILMTLFYVVSTYIFEKIKYINYCQRPPDLNFEFEMKNLKNLEFTFLVMSLGFFAFVKIVSGNFGIYSIILVCITALDYFIMDPKLIHTLISSKEKLSELKYEEVYLSFAMDYNRQNPLTQQKAFKEWFEQMQLKNEIIQVDDEIQEFITDHRIQVEQIQKPENKIDNNTLEAIFNYILDKQNKPGKQKDTMDYNKFNIDSLLDEKDDENEFNKVNYYKLSKETRLRRKFLLKETREKEKKINVKLQRKQRPRKFPLHRTLNQINNRMSSNNDELKLRKQLTFGQFYRNQKSLPFNPLQNDTKELKQQKIIQKSESMNILNKNKPKKFYTIQQQKKEESIQSSENTSSYDSRREYFNFSRDEDMYSKLSSSQNIFDKRSLIDSKDLFEIEEEKSLYSESYESCEPQSLPTTQPTNDFNEKDFNN